MPGKKKVISHDPLADLVDSGEESIEETASESIEATGEQEATAVTPTVDLESSLTIADVSALHQKLLTVFDAGEPVSIVAGDLELVDGAGLQLLSALFKEAAEKGIAVSWASVSDQLRQSAKDIGLAQQLGLA